MTDTTTTLEQLNEFLSIDLGLAASCTTAIGMIEDPDLRQQIEEIQRSHEMRADILREEVQDLGGTPTDQFHRWSMITADSGKAALKALLVAEEWSLNHHRGMLDRKDFDVRDLVEGDLLPEAERTHAIISSLQAVQWP